MRENPVPATLMAQADEQPPAPMQQPPRGAAAAMVASIRNPVNPPLGAASTPDIYKGQPPVADFVPRPDRWRIGFPDDKWYKHGSYSNPYSQNTLKGDYPIIGNHTFLNLTLEETTFVTQKRLPVPSDVSSQDPEETEFFGRGNIFFTAPEFSATVDLFH